MVQCCAVLEFVTLDAFWTVSERSVVLCHLLVGFKPPLSSWFPGRTSDELRSERVEKLMRVEKSVLIGAHCVDVYLRHSGRLCPMHGWRQQETRKPRAFSVWSLRTPHRYRHPGSSKANKPVDRAPSEWFSIHMHFTEYTLLPLHLSISCIRKEFSSPLALTSHALNPASV